MSGSSRHSLRRGNAGLRASGNCIKEQMRALLKLTHSQQFHSQQFHSSVSHLQVAMVIATKIKSSTLSLQTARTGFDPHLYSSGSSSTDPALMESSNCKVFYIQREHCDRQCLPPPKSQDGVQFILLHQGRGRAERLYRLYD